MLLQRGQKLVDELREIAVGRVRTNSRQVNDYLAVIIRHRLYELSIEFGTLELAQVVDSFLMFRG